MSTRRRRYPARFAFPLPVQPFGFRRSRSPGCPGNEVATPVGQFQPAFTLPHGGSRTLSRCSRRIRQTGRRTRLELQIHQQAVWRFQCLFHPDEEDDRRLSINQAMIIGQSQIHHRTDGNLAVYDNRAFLDPMHAKNT